MKGTPEFPVSFRLSTFSRSVLKTRPRLARYHLLLESSKSTLQHRLSTERERQLSHESSMPPSSWFAATYHLPWKSDCAGSPNKTLILSRAVPWEGDSRFNAAGSCCILICNVTYCHLSTAATNCRGLESLQAANTDNSRALVFFLEGLPGERNVSMALQRLLSLPVWKPVAVKRRDISFLFEEEPKRRQVLTYLLTCQN